MAVAESRDSVNKARNFLLLFLSWTDSISAVEGEILVRGRSSSKTSPPVPALLVGSGGATSVQLPVWGRLW